MRLRNSHEGYGLVPQAMHWITVALVILAWFLGQFDDIFPKGTARAASLFIHISAGLAVIGILVLRLFWRLADPPPPIEHTVLGIWLDRAGRLAHVRPLCASNRRSTFRYRPAIRARRCSADIWSERDSFTVGR